MGPRKYFLDWLRVIAFGLLILYHVGCLYATWPYNLQSPRNGSGIEWLLLALTPWRMALLFLISGVASRYLLVKLGPGGLALDRLRRLLPVLLFAMFVVIPPQTYVELLDKGLTHQDYLHFWLFSYLAADQTLVAPLHKTMPTYDHLWFLVYLLIYALVLAFVAGVAGFLGGVFGVQRRSPVDRWRLPLWLLLTAPALWLIGAIFVMERIRPATYWPGNDWGSHLKWAGMFATGVLLAVHDEYWDWVRRRRLALALVAVLFLVLQSINRAVWLTGLADPVWSAALWSIASGLYAWTIIGALAGYAGRYLNHPSALLSHLNEAILPVYVLHQPILLVAAYLMFPLRLPLTEEAAVLIAVTAFGSLAVYEIAIRPLAVTRFLFGLKPRVRPAV